VLPVRRGPAGLRPGGFYRGDRIEESPGQAILTGRLLTEGTSRRDWRRIAEEADARGAIVGLSRYHTSAHLARATLEAICYQSRDVIEAMARDSGVTLDVLKVDGGVTANSLCMQLQADILGVPVSRPVVAETTALGAAYAAGLAVGFWKDTDELRANWNEDQRWSPQWSDQQRADGYAGWRKAIDRTLDWVDVG